MQLFINHGADIHAKFDLNPLDVAIQNNQGKVARILFENGAKVSTKGWNGINSIENVLYDRNFGFAKLIWYNQV